MRDVVLIIDVMSLQQMTIYDKKSDSLVGLVDYGATVPKPETCKATEALVFRTVGMNGY